MVGLVGVKYGENVHKANQSQGRDYRYRSVSVFSSKNWDQEEPENWVTIMRRYGGGQGDRNEAEAEVLGRTQLFIRHGSHTPGGYKTKWKIPR